MPAPEEERFDVLDAKGETTGRTKGRTAVHRDGEAGWRRAMEGGGGEGTPRD